MTTFDIQALTDDVYPSLYIYRIELEEEPEDVEVMVYPTIIDYTEKFGTNPLEMLG